ncbi:MAG: hypothetical protein WAV05_00600 [Anaerolineales bacterium]
MSYNDAACNCQTQAYTSCLTAWRFLNPGYLGGRWWVDVNGNGIQDAGDSFLLCPLLGPGRTSP